MSANEKNSGSFRNELILTSKQFEEFESNGFVIVPGFISEEVLKIHEKAIDNLQGKTPFTSSGRWDLRNILSHNTIFVDLLIDNTLLTIMTQLLGWNIKLLGSHIVKMNSESRDKTLPVNWHRDGGVLSAELPDPLPPLFVKVSFCISGSSEPEGGELLAVPGSHRLIGEPAIDSKTGLPFGASKILLTPGDMLVFDWRLWHAVNRNSSQVVRRTLYFTFGFRWLTPIDYQIAPEKLLNLSSIHRQLLGGATELGNYLPSESELPIKSLAERLLKTERRCN